MQPHRVISGGQTGADQGGLRAAEQLGIPTGGYAPEGYWTEDGPMMELMSRFCLTSLRGKYDYEPRTRKNVETADATAIFGKRSRGSNLTERICKECDKPMIWLLRGEPIASDSLQFRAFLMRYQPSVLNIAGNRESVNPGIGARVEQFLLSVWGRRVRK